MKTILETNFTDLKLFRRGKVRDVYDLDDKILIVASDRISAFDYIMPQPVPGKGAILSNIAVFWFNHTQHILPNHLISNNPDEYPDILQKYKEDLQGRSMLVKKTNPFPVEFVVRGYVAGSAWKEYKTNGTICGITLPKGLKEFQQLPEPIFTPATKAESGHDENISFEEMCEIIGKEKGEYLRSKSIELFNFGHQLLNEKGLILADTKFEFGENDKGEIILIDEALTPDSSRFWLKSTYAPGIDQMNFDKQVLRDYLLSTDWDRNSPPPDLPDEIIMKTLAKYNEALKMIIK
ncbi:MAG: phosphoribosylaminoimidazolesuccinocarboxamide synthase [Ignavibacteria bacterium GWF2_33_9]|nr:MAG: phosphoribosylaminoimidazolesuccinocarboxamide synthase [Ignavibacteria bacterium GWF2_33_9]